MDRQAMDAPARLRGLLDRVPLAHLLSSSTVCRNALQDTFPDDGLVASVLAEAAADGAVRRLLDADAGVRIEHTGPAIRQQLSDRRGIAPEAAAWSLAVWAIATGRLDGSVAPRPAERAAGLERMFLGSAPVVAEPRRARLAAVTGMRPPARASRTPAGIPARTAPTAVRARATLPTVVRRTDRVSRPGRRVATAVLLTLAGVVVAGLTTAAVLQIGPSAPVRLALAASAAATVQAPDAAQTAGSAHAVVPVGAAVHALHGPVEVDAGGVAVRLDTGASLTYTAAAGFWGPAAMRLTAGRAYVTAPDGQRLDLATSAGTARVDSGRLVASCASTCTLQALDESVALQDSTSTTRLAAHQAVVGTGRPVFAATDVLRGNRWITENLARDGAEHRARTTIAGRSLVGPWRFSMTRSDFPGPYIVSVSIARSTSCATTTCPLTATTDVRSDVGRVHPHGTVVVDDSSGSRITVAYAAVGAACDPQMAIRKKPDGRTSFVDDLTLTGPESGATKIGHGTRTATYAPAAGSLCTTSAFTTTRWTVQALHRAPSASDVPEFKDEAQMLINFVRGGATGCARGYQGSATGRWADLVCSYPAARAAHPTTIEYVNYKSQGTETGGYVTAAYDAIAGKAGVGLLGSCAASPCTTALTDVRGGYFVQQLGSGRTRLVAYDTGPSDLMLIATGTLTPAQMVGWFQAQNADERDANGAWSWAPILRTGF